MTRHGCAWPWCWCLLGLGLIALGCGRGGEAPAAGGTVQGTPRAPANQSPGAAIAGLSIEFQSDPDPMRAGDNMVDVIVKDADGSPVTDATVTVVFSMPAMPSMNMPAMRSTASLAHEGSGRYRGNEQLSMGGTWNVAVTVSRGPEELGRRNLSVIAK